METTNEFEKLEAALFAARQEIAYPATPPLSRRVREQLKAQPAGRFLLPSWVGTNWLGRRPARLAFSVAAALVLALALLLTNPDTRDAIAQLLGLRTVRIIQVTPTPTPTGVFTPQPTPTPGVAPVTQCCLTTLEEAQQRASFKILVPRGETPSQAFFTDFDPGSGSLQQVILVFGNSQSPRYTLYEADSVVYGKFITFYSKDMTEGTLVDLTEVNGHEARWLSGASHIVAVLDATGHPVPRTERIVSANTLVWEVGELTYRLETTLGEKEAIRVAESLTVAAITPTPTAAPTPKPSTQCCETTLDQARALVSFKILLPSGELPSKVYSQQIPDFGDAQQVILVFGDPSTPRFTLYEANNFLYGKLVSEGTVIEETTVHRERALWLSGAPHLLVYLDANGKPEMDTERPVNANTLAWESGDVTLRLETKLGEQEAVRFAESLR